MDAPHRALEGGFPVRARSLAAAALVAALAVASLGPVSATDPDVIQPGDRVITAASWCTLNFVLDGSNDAYIGTAGHCVSEGDRVDHPTLGTFGEVVYANDHHDDDGVDFALVDVDDGREDELVASVDGHPGTPSGVATPSETAPGDQILLSGHGQVVRLTEPTREDRRSLLVEHTPERVQSTGPVVPGDSGGPLVHAPTGEALGIVSAQGLTELPPSTDAGPTLDHVLGALEDAGYAVSLRTDS